LTIDDVQNDIGHGRSYDDDVELTQQVTSTCWRACLHSLAMFNFTTTTPSSTTSSDALVECQTTVCFGGKQTDGTPVAQIDRIHQRSAWRLLIQMITSVRYPDTRHRPSAACGCKITAKTLGAAAAADKLFPHQLTTNQDEVCCLDESV